MLTIVNIVNFKYIMCNCRKTISKTNEQIKCKYKERKEEKKKKNKICEQCELITTICKHVN